MSNAIIVLGTTLEEKTFRPSDWIDRLCSSTGQFDKHKRITLSPYVYPIMHRGKRCLYLSQELKKTNAGVYQYVMEFIESNCLKTELLD